jgi:hypothetical protein
MVAPKRAIGDGCDSAHGRTVGATQQSLSPGDANKLKAL